MPQFAPGEVKTAVAPIVAKPAGMDCEAELFLGPDEVTKLVTSGRIPFVSTGASKDVNLPVTMPGAPGTYHGYIDVFAGGLRFLAYILMEDVVIAAPVVPPFSISGSGAGYVCPLMTSWWYPDLTFVITNPHSVAVTHILQLWKRSLSLGTGGVENPNAVTLSGTLIAPGQGSPVTVTLQPSGSYSHRITGWAVHPDIPGMVMYQLTMARPRSFFYWLQDELGNKSPEVNIVRS